MACLWFHCVGHSTLWFPASYMQHHIEENWFSIKKKEKKIDFLGQCFLREAMSEVCGRGNEFMGHLFARFYICKLYTCCVYVYGLPICIFYIYQRITRVVINGLKMSDFLSSNFCLSACGEINCTQELWMYFTQLTGAKGLAKLFHHFDLGLNPTNKYTFTQCKYHPSPLTICPLFLQYSSSLYSICILTEDSDSLSHCFESCTRTYLWNPNCTR